MNDHVAEPFRSVLNSMASRSGLNDRLPRRATDGAECNSPALATHARCACDSIWCNHCPDHRPAETDPCLAAAAVVVVLRYPGAILSVAKPLIGVRIQANILRKTPREVRLALCRPCADWWVSQEHDGVTATLQVGSEVSK